MTKPTGSTSLTTRKLLTDLKKLSIKENVGLWKAVAKQIKRPTRISKKINLERIERHIKEGEIVLVPGKVLSGGELTKKVIVAAFKFSGKAREKINKTGGKAMSIQAFMKEYPKAKNVRIIG